MSFNYMTEAVKRPKLKYRLVSKWLNRVIENRDCTAGVITYIFCNDEYLKEINAKFLDHHYFTDIVTFDYVDGKLISGDMFISIERVTENAVTFGSELSEEFLRVIVHGLLHLLGYKDGSQTEKLEMRSAENRALIEFKDLSNEGIK
jgi:rRNA maturation RNase YbeY